jgi:hypothetical protein
MSESLEQLIKALEELVATEQKRHSATMGYGVGTAIQSAHDHGRLEMAREILDMVKRHAVVIPAAFRDALP